jgi:hypothetical protein
LTSPLQPDYSRFDLNGDGFTGGAANRARFNLDLSDSNGQSTYNQISQYPNGTAVVLDENALTDFEILCYYIHSSLFDETELNQFNVELRSISATLGRNISCADPSVALNVNATQIGWSGLPAKITLRNLWATTIANFQFLGNSMTNTCGTGERGSPVFSNSVASDAVFFGARDIVGVPFQSSGPFPNARNCSSFYATKSIVLPGQQTWINATARARQFGAFTLDWEYQVRYSTGDPTNNFQGKQCSVGVVPNSGSFVRTFDVPDCSHTETNTVSE